jgi:DNA polymerase/3'-5' exonuclease PolX
MKLKLASEIAERTLNEISPHCFRAEIGGSIRRGNPEVKDIEIIVIPKPFERGLLESGLATVVNQWEMVKGPMIYGKTRYTQRILPEGIKLDLFFATPENWGLVLATRTGSASFSKYKLAYRWSSLGFKSVDGYLTKDGVQIEVREEEVLFRLLQIPFVDPKFRI